MDSLMADPAYTHTPRLGVPFASRPAHTLLRRRNLLLGHARAAAFADHYFVKMVNFADDDADES